MTKKPTKEKQRRIILKTLFGLGEATKNELFNAIITSKTKEENRITSRATVGKRADELFDEGIIKIEKKGRGPLGTHYCALSLKGLAYLILKCGLSKKEITDALQKLFNHDKFKPLKYMIKSPDYPTFLAQITSESILNLRPKVSFEFFDEDYMFSQLSSLIKEAFLKHPEKINNSPQNYIKYLRHIGLRKSELIELHKNKIKKSRAEIKRLRLENEADKIILNKIKKEF